MNNSNIELVYRICKLLISPLNNDINSILLLTKFITIELFAMIVIMSISSYQKVFPVSNTYVKLEILKTIVLVIITILIVFLFYKL